MICLSGDPNQFDDVALQNSGDSSWQGELSGEQGLKRSVKPRSTKPQDFQVCYLLSLLLNGFKTLMNILDSNKNLSSSSIRRK